MDKEDVLRERINSLIDNELLSVEMLQEAKRIEKDSLENILLLYKLIIYQGYRMH